MRRSYTAGCQRARVILQHIDSELITAESAEALLGGQDAIWSLWFVEPRMRGKLPHQFARERRIPFSYLLGCRWRW